MFKNSTTPSEADMLQTQRISQVKAWVRELLALPDETPVMVTELRCAEVGCPPRETVVAVLRGPGDTRQEKLPRGVDELTREDVAALCERIKVTTERTS
jgi:hypothetical protein